MSKLSSGSALLERFIELFAEKIYSESRPCGRCGRKGVARIVPRGTHPTFTLLDSGVVVKQVVRCMRCHEEDGVCSDPGFPPDVPPDWRLPVRSHDFPRCLQKITHFEVLDDLMELLQVAAIEDKSERKEGHEQIARFMFANVRRVCEEWCRDEYAELRRKKYLYLYKETQVTCYDDAQVSVYRQCLAQDHTPEYREMYDMMGNSFYSNRNKILCLLDLIRDTLIERPSHSIFWMWVALVMTHVDRCDQFVAAYPGQVDTSSAEYKGLEQKLQSLELPLGIKKIPVAFVLFEIPRFYSYVEMVLLRGCRGAPSTASIYGEKGPHPLLAFLTPADRFQLQIVEINVVQAVAERKICPFTPASVEAQEDSLKLTGENHTPKLLTGDQFRAELVEQIKARLEPSVAVAALLKVEQIGLETLMRKCNEQMDESGKLRLPPQTTPSKSPSDGKANTSISTSSSGTTTRTVYILRAPSPPPSPPSPPPPFFSSSVITQQSTSTSTKSTTKPSSTSTKSSSTSTKSSSTSTKSSSTSTKSFSSTPTKTSSTSTKSSSAFTKSSTPTKSSSTSTSSTSITKSSASTQTGSTITELINNPPEHLSTNVKEALASLPRPTEPVDFMRFIVAEVDVEVLRRYRQLIPEELVGTSLLIATEKGLVERIIQDTKDIHLVREYICQKYQIFVPPDGDGYKYYLEEQKKMEKFMEDCGEEELKLLMKSNDTMTQEIATRKYRELIVARVGPPSPARKKAELKKKLKSSIETRKSMVSPRQIPAAAYAKSRSGGGYIVPLTSCPEDLSGIPFTTNWTDKMMDHLHEYIAKGLQTARERTQQKDYDLDLEGDLKIITSIGYPMAVAKLSVLELYRQALWSDTDEVFQKYNQEKREKEEEARTKREMKKLKKEKKWKGKRGGEQASTSNTSNTSNAKMPSSQVKLNSSPPRTTEQSPRQQVPAHKVTVAEKTSASPEEGKPYMDGTLTSKGASVPTQHKEKPNKSEQDGGDTGSRGGASEGGGKSGGNGGPLFAEKTIRDDPPNKVGTIRDDPPNKVGTIRDDPPNKVGTIRGDPPYKVGTTRDDPLNMVGTTRGDPPKKVDSSTGGQGEMAQEVTVSKVEKVEVLVVDNTSDLWSVKDKLQDRSDHENGHPAPIENALLSDVMSVKARRTTARDKFKVCENCGTEIVDRIRVCSACKRVAYCNSDCQREHWKTHKQTCSHYLRRDDVTG